MSPQEYYFETRGKLEKLSSQETARLDKIVFAISGGSLVLSINFSKDLVIPASDLKILFLAWFILSSSIFVHIFGYIFSQKATGEIVKKLDKWASVNFQPPTFTPVSRWSRAVSWSNLLQVLFMWLGIVTLGLFMAFNMISNSSFSGVEKNDDSFKKAEVPLFAPYRDEDPRTPAPQPKPARQAPATSTDEEGP